LTLDHAHLQVAHILFVDSPTGAGFSFSKQPQGYDVGEVLTSLQLHDFLIKVPNCLATTPIHQFVAIHSVLIGCIRFTLIYVTLSSGSLTIPSFSQVLSTSGEIPWLEELYGSSRKRFQKVETLLIVVYFHEQSLFLPPKLFTWLIFSP
jgi:hypothetical protein